MSFLFTSLLTIGLPLCAIPLILHLINLRRQRRVRWAAMEFLLQSQRRHRKWILLKQFLLILLRTLAIAALVLMLAGPLLKSRLGELLGTSSTHHIVLIDDSFSMTDRQDGTSSFQVGKRTVQQFVDQVMQQGGVQNMTLLRFSEAGRLSAGTQPEFYRQRVDSTLGSRVEELLATMTASQLAATPLDALDGTIRLPEPEEGEQLVVMLVSDFRDRDWQARADLRTRFTELRSRGAQLRLVHCARQEHDNLAITRLTPEQGLAASGVETWLELAVANYSDAPAEKVTVQIREDDVDRTAIELDDIPPRSETTHRVRVRFATAGPHSVTASLGGDAVEADNLRYFAADVPDAYRVLVIDGSENGRDGYYFQAALAPGGPVRTGWQPRVERPDFLRQQQRLDEYGAVVLLDTPRLDEAAVAVLEAYVRRGGGLAYFVGDRTDIRFANASLYKNGEGLLPAPLSTVTQLRPRRSSDVADLQIGDHPLFHVFAGERNSFLELLLVDFYMAVDPTWDIQQEDRVEVIATLRDRNPFALERRFENGRVLLLLSKLAPESSALGRWSNWSLNPVFPVLTNELAAYLSAGLRRVEELEIGQPFELALDASTFLPEVRFDVPVAGGGTATRPVMATGEDDSLEVVYPDTTIQGVYRANLDRRDGKTTAAWFAVNVDAEEGDLRRLEEGDLANVLEDIPHEFTWADTYADSTDQLAGFELSDLFLYVLLAVLVGEQLLAVAASFHHAAPVGAKA